MFSQRDRENTERPAPPEEPHYYRNVAAYRSYEEVVAAKRRRGRLRRGIAVCAALALMGGLGCYLLIQEGDQRGETSLSDPAPVSGSQSEESQEDQAPDAEGQDNQPTEKENFAMKVQPKPEEGQTANYPALVVKDVTGIVKKARPSVVGVTTESFQTYSTGSTGSGIILSEDGYIVTNNHVIEGGDNVSVTLDNGETYSADVVGADAKTVAASFLCRKQHGLNPTQIPSISRITRNAWAWSSEESSRHIFSYPPNIKGPFNYKN